jgi:hypothetical protein
MKEILKKLKACNQAREWVGNRTIEQAIQECPRGDWMLWLFQKLFPDDLQLLTLAKGHCANTLRYLMTDERSINAIDTAIAFGEGRATREELNAADATADAAAAAAYAAAAYATYAAAAAAAYATYADADATYAATFAADAAAALQAADARKANQLQTANICRKYIGEKLIEGCNKLKEVKND